MKATYRPPSEASSLIIQTTMVVPIIAVLSVICTKVSDFRQEKIDEVVADLRMAQVIMKGSTSIFS